MIGHFPLADRALNLTDRHGSGCFSPTVFRLTMHYVPESAREFLPEETSGRGGDPDSATPFHYRSAPVYLLTSIVGLLLGADLILGLVADPDWDSWRSLLGYRLALWAALLGGARIVYQTVEGLLEGKIGADLALTIATVAAILLREYETAALVVFIALCGESIEGYTVDRAQRAIRRIFSLCPQTARVLRNGRETEVELAEVEPNEEIFVRPGERIPVDGTVARGTSSVDQSALTGESLPIDKVPGSNVFAGTLNQFGLLTITAQRIGETTTFSRVVQLVAEAAEKKTPLERTADRLARLFLPIVLGVALLTLVGWRMTSGDWSAGFVPALAVLVVACPCPLILATPTAVMASMAWLAKQGIVVKGSAALERLAQVDTFVFDKTGTLTGGNFVPGDYYRFAAPTDLDLLQAAALAEKQSEHPLARVIVKAAEKQLAVITNPSRVMAHPGAGVEASVRSTQLGDWIFPLLESEAPESADVTIAVGNRRLMEKIQIDWTDEVEREFSRMEQAGQTVLCVAIPGTLLGLIGVRDAVRQESLETLSELRAAGIERIALLSGDRKITADAIADELGGIDPVLAELLPADKARWIEQETAAGRRVAMVGDGVNDAPALATATVGIALGGVGSDIAAEAGDLVLMGDPLKPLPGLLRLSRELVKNIRQSIWLFAIGMNSIGIVLGATGILSPVGAAIFHEAASLAVMFNAMRLLWFEGWETTALGKRLARFDRLAEWTTEFFSPGKWVHRLVDHRARIARLILGVLMLVWLFSNLVLIRQDESALVTRFGKLHSELGPGWHWQWPTPFERVFRAPVKFVQSIEIGFRSEGNSNEDSPAVIEWVSDHGDENPEYESEGLILTGDEVSIELTADVQYRIRDLKRWLWENAQPKATLRAMTEAVLREQAARESLDDLLTDRRREIETACLLVLQEQADSLGVEILGLNLLDLHPPRAVVPAYRDVADALEEQQELINAAEEYYARTVIAAAGETAIDLLQDEAGNDWKLTDASWDRLRKQPDLLSGNLSGTLMQAEADAVKTIARAHSSTARLGSLLEQSRRHPQLTAWHLYWNTIEAALAERPLTIVDPKASGRQQLFLNQSSGLEKLLQASPLNQPDPVEDELP